MIRRAPIARADHVFPLVSGLVHHRPAIPQKSNALLDQPFGDIAPNLQTRKPAPFTRFQETMTNRHGAGLLEQQRKLPRCVAGFWGQREIDTLPITWPNANRLLGVAVSPITAFQSGEKRNCGVGADPDAAVIILPGYKVHSPVIEPLVFDSDFSLAGIETNLLRLHADERLFASDGKMPDGAAADDRV